MQTFEKKKNTEIYIVKGLCYWKMDSLWNDLTLSRLRNFESDKTNVTQRHRHSYQQVYWESGRLPFSDREIPLYSPVCLQTSPFENNQTNWEAMR